MDICAREHTCEQLTNFSEPRKIRLRVREALLMEDALLERMWHARIIEDLGCVRWRRYVNLRTRDGEVARDQRAFDVRPDDAQTRLLRLPTRQAHRSLLKSIRSRYVDWTQRTLEIAVRLRDVERWRHGRRRRSAAHSHCCCECSVTYPRRLRAIRDECAQARARSGRCEASSSVIAQKR